MSYNYNFLNFKYVYFTFRTHLLALSAYFQLVFHQFSFLSAGTGITTLRKNLSRQRENNISLSTRSTGLSASLNECVNEGRNLTKKVAIARGHNDTLKSALEIGFKELEDVIGESENAMDDAV